MSIDFEFLKFNDVFDFFLLLVNIECYEGVDENFVDIKVIVCVVKFYDVILEVNFDWIGVDWIYDFNIFMMWMLFCFFVEGILIFEKGLFIMILMNVFCEDGLDLV